MDTRRTTIWGRMAATSAAAFMTLAIAAPAALGDSLWVAAETTEAVDLTAIESGSVEAQFTISVTNSEAVPVSSVYVTFEDGQEVTLGNVGPGKSAESAATTRTLDTSAEPSRNLVLPVTLTFIQNGLVNELPTTLTVHLGAPLAEG